MVGRRDNRVDTEHQRRGDEEGARDVGSRAQPDPAFGLEQAGGQRGGHDPQGDVDEEDPVPADGLGEDTAGEQADRGTGGGDEAVDADRPGLLPRLREHRHDHAQDHGGGHGTTDTLGEPRNDQHLLTPGHAAQQGCHGEHAQAGHEDALAADQVAEPAGQEQQAGESDQVGVDDPGQA